MGDSPLVARDVHCPVCGHTYRFHAPRSTAAVLDRRDADFCPYYTGVNPLLYAVWVCPECGYAALKEHFREIGEREAAVLKVNLRGTTDHRKQDFTRAERSLFAAILSVQLAIRCYEWRTTPTEVKAGMRLRLAWLCRQGRDRRREQEHLKDAAGLYAEAYDKGLARTASVTPEHVAYLVGELNRRIGNGKLAVDWFMRAIQGDLSKGDVWQRARDQLYEARESIRFFEYLQNVEILKPLAIEEIAFIAAHAKSRSVPAGRTLFKEGEVGDSMVIVMQGAAEARIEGRVVGTVAPPDVLGEMSLLTGRPRSATVLATETLEAVEIDRVTFRTILQANPAVAEEIARIVAERKERNAAMPDPTEDGEDVQAIGLVRQLKSLFGST